MKYNTVSFYILNLYLHVVSNQNLFKIWSYRNINKRQNEDFQSNGGTYFQPIFVFYIEKQRKYYPCAIILIVVKELFSVL